MRHPLRGRSGCDRCKLRRKKCDERRPVCSSCQRLKMLCTWERSAPNTQTSQTSWNDLVPEQIQDGRPLAGRLSVVHPRYWHMIATQLPMFGQGATGSNIDLMIQFPKVFGGLISRTALKSFHDNASFVTMASEYHFLVSPMAAFTACITFFVDRKDKAKHQVAIRSYKAAVHSVREMLPPETTQYNVVTLFAMTLLGLIEVSPVILDTMSD